MRIFCLIPFFLGVSIATADPIFENSVVSNDIDFITSADPSRFACLTYSGQERAEMPDKRSDALFADNVDVFEIKFDDGTSLLAYAHPDLGGRAEAADVLSRIGPRLGRLPHFMRDRLSHIILHAGDETAFAESEAQFFVLYDRNVARRIATNDLEETLFHESVHATLDAEIASSTAWRAAQKADGTFLTRYARSQPQREDLAETALFAFAHIHHPDRLPATVRTSMAELVPARLAFFKTLFEELETTAQHQKVQVTCDR